MVYIMPLSIVGVNGTAIDVVNGPVALLRGGASPIPRAFLLYRLQIDLLAAFGDAGIKNLHGDINEEGYSREPS